MGVPMLGCDCHVCTSTNPKNHRYRCSVLIGTHAGNILIDTTPELRLQLLRLNVSVIDAQSTGKPRQAHFSVEQALESIARVKPRQAYFTHMAHTMEYDELMRTLPKSVEPAYDGLKFEF